MPEYRFVGRRDILGRIAAVVAQTLEGRPSVVVLAGEPGIGKTRLAEEAASLAARSGMRSHWGRCHAGEGRAPYWPWVQVLRSIRAAAGEADQETGHLLRDLGEPSSSRDPNQADPTSRRIRLFDATAALLARISAISPLLLAIDDLQSADLASLQLLEFLSLELRRCPVMLLGTYRSEDLDPRDPLVATLGELARRPGFSQVRLEGLEEGDVMELVAAVAPAAAREVARAVFRRSEGNPLYATELARFLAAEGAGPGPVADAAAAAIPASISLVIGGLIQRRSNACAGTLACASLVGREFGQDLLERVAGLPPREIAAAIDEGARAGFLAPVEGSPGRFRFAHPLVHEVFMERVPPARRALLHGTIAESLEESLGDAAGRHAAELAHHFGLASSRDAAPKLARYAAVAARESLAAHDYPEAAQLFRRALQAAAEGTDERQAADLLFGLGQAEAFDGEEEQALADLERAFDRFERIGATEAAVEVATFPVSFDYGTVVPFHLLERAAARVKPGTREAALLSICRATSDFRRQPDGAAFARALERALAFAVRSGDEALEQYALLAWCAFEPAAPGLPDSPRRVDRLLALAHARRDLRCETVAHLTAALHAKDEVSARKHRDAALFAAERFRDRGLLSAVLFMASLGQLAKGEWHKARENLDRALLLQPRFMNGGRYERRAELAYETGDFAEGDRYLALFLDAYRREGGTHLHRFQMLPRAIATRAHVTGQQEHLEVALEIAEAILSSPSSSPLNIMAALWGAGLVAAERGERSRAEACYRRIEATLGKQRNEGSHRARALIAMAAGDAAAARGHFEKALEPAYRKVSPPSYAWACVDLAESFGDDAFPGQPDRLRALLAESRDIARELGMRPLAHRASALLARHTPGRACPPAGLSPRELEVLRHLALGKTNQEISRDLAISEHTVAHHLTSLFAKIRVTNRVDAATWAVRRGL